MQAASKAVLALVLGPIILPLLFLYFYSLPTVALWLWLWLLCFGWTVHSKWNTETRGMFFIFSSVGLAVIGRHIFDGPEHHNDALSVEMLSEIMIVMGAGIGSNLMSHWLLHEKTTKSG